jgi:hypothetical protein
MEDRAVPSAVVTVEKVADADEVVTPGLFRFTRTGDTSQELTVYYSVGGTAAPGDDYQTLSGQVTFPANWATADVTVLANADGVPELTETVVVTLTGGTGYTVGTPDAATVKIADADARLTFDLTDGRAGAIGFDLAWEDVDPGETSQSLPLSDFKLNLGGQLLTTEATSGFTTSGFTTEPMIQFEYGVLAGVAFALDTSGVAGYAYASVSASGWTVTAVDAVTSEEYTGTAANHGSGTLNFAGATNDVALWRAVLTVTWRDPDGNTHTETYTREFNANTTATTIVNEFRVGLLADGWYVAVSPDGRELTTGGHSEGTVTGITYSTQTRNNAGDWVQNNNLNAPTARGRSPNTAILINQ